MQDLLSELKQLLEKGLTREEAFEELGKVKVITPFTKDMLTRNLDLEAMFSSKIEEKK